MAWQNLMRDFALLYLLGFWLWIVEKWRILGCFCKYHLRFCLSGGGFVVAIHLSILCKKFLRIVTKIFKIYSLIFDSPRYRAIPAQSLSPRPDSVTTTRKSFGKVRATFRR